MYCLFPLYMQNYLSSSYTWVNSFYGQARILPIDLLNVDKCFANTILRSEGAVFKDIVGRARDAFTLFLIP